MKNLKNMKYYILILIVILLIGFGIWLKRNRASFETEKKNKLYGRNYNG